jgi:hypothetical protein
VRELRTYRDLGTSHKDAGLEPFADFWGDGRTAKCPGAPVRPRNPAAKMATTGSSGDFGRLHSEPDAGVRTVAGARRAALIDAYRLGGASAAEAADATLLGLADTIWCATSTVAPVCAKACPVCGYMELPGLESPVRLGLTTQSVGVDESGATGTSDCSNSSIRFRGQPSKVSILPVVAIFAAGFRGLTGSPGHFAVRPSPQKSANGSKPASLCEVPKSL